MLTALFNTTDKLQVISSSVADLEVVATYTDMVKSSGAWLSTNRQGTKITTATTTDILAAPASTEVRGINSLFIRNKHASTANDVTVQYNANATLWELYKTTLNAGETLEYIEGVGFFKLTSVIQSTLYSASTAAQGAGFATDTYLTGSYIKFPALPKIGTKYKCRFSVSKTAAGTATPIIQVRYGTAGTTADTSRNSHTFSAGTAATDVGVFEVYAIFRAVGASAVVQSWCSLVSQPTTGFSSLLKGVQTTSGTFDSTVASLGAGVSVNGGTSAAWTVQLVSAEIENAFG